MRNVRIAWRSIPLGFVCAVMLCLSSPLLKASFAAPGASEDIFPEKWAHIAVIAANTAKGDIPKLRAGLNAGLNAGLTINEIKEILIQMYAYSGFPRSLNAIQAFMAVVEERRSGGVEDEIGAEAAPLPSGKSREQIGREVLIALAGEMAKAPPRGYQLFVPDIDRFLMEHLFADIFSRGVLDYQEREVATIAALSAVEGLDLQLAGHVMVGVNIGVTEARLRKLIPAIASGVGDKEANRLAETLDKREEARRSNTSKE